MDALLDYINTNQPNAKDIIISTPPGPAVLLWTNSNSRPQLTGISIVSELAGNYYNTQQGQTTLNIARELYRKLSSLNFPFLKIEYDFPNDILVINNLQYTVEQGGQYIAQQFNLITSGSPTKAINNSNSVTDPFHTWSRDYFSGSQVQKLDLDLINFDNQANTFSSIFEIKRSPNSNFNTWQPYSNDLSNYLMSMDLANLLNVPFYTVHHNYVSNTPMPPTTTVNVFTYQPKQQMQWNTFRAMTNRTQMSVNQVLNLL